MAMAESNFLGSSLNPNAPDFIPQSYKEVEDFSAEWWFLVQTNPAFNSFWMHEHAAQLEADLQEMPEELLPEEDDVYSSVLEEFEGSQLHDSTQAVAAH